MATITKYNSVQFSEVSNQQLAGVALVYTSVNREGEERSSCVHLGGEEFVPANCTEDEIFRVWKNVIKLHWDAKRLEAGMKVDNGGIAIKLRGTTPSQIVVRSESGRAKFVWYKDDSVFDRIGIMPTTKDLQELARDYKKKMHKAAAASFKALKTRFEFEEAAPEVVEEIVPILSLTVIPEAVATDEVVAEVVEEIVAEEVKPEVVVAEAVEEVSKKKATRKGRRKSNKKAVVAA